MKKIRRGELKEALVERAFAVAREGRLHAYTMRDFAKDLGVSPGAAYRHFRSKDELFATAAKRMIEQTSKVFAKKLPKNPEKLKCSELVDTMCAIDADIAVSTLEDAELWLLHFWPHVGAEIQNDRKPARQDLMKIIVPYRSILLERGAISRLPNPIDILMLNFSIDASIAKFAGNKLTEYFTQCEVEDYMHDDLGVAEKFEAEHLRQLVKNITLNYFENLGYNHKEWLIKDGRSAEQPI